MVLGCLYIFFGLCDLLICKTQRCIMLHFLEWIDIISTLNKPLGSNQSGVRIGFRLDATIIYKNVTTNSKSKTSLNVTRTHDSLNCDSA